MKARELIYSIGVVLLSIATMSPVEASDSASFQLTDEDCSPAWDPDFGVTEILDGNVLALALFDDGNGQALYAGGSFTTAADTTVNHVARWDGAAWQPLGVGTDADVFALTVFDDGSGPALFVGGNFNRAGDLDGTLGIAKWDGQNWSAVGNGTTSMVYSMVVFDDGNGDALYVGGGFANAGGVTGTSRIARWDGSNWTQVGNGGVSGQVFALTATQNGIHGGPELYAGGLFNTAGGTPAAFVARWDGSQWAGLGNGTDLWVNALAIFDDGLGGGPALYAGGLFSSASEAPDTNRIAKWDGENWSSVGGGVANTVTAMEVFDDGTGAGPALFVGGGFVFAGDVLVSNVARWDGLAWAPLDRGVNGGVDALLSLTGDAETGASLILGGRFDRTNGGPATLRIAKWQGCAKEPERLPADVNGDGSVDAVDVQLVINAALGLPIDSTYRPDLNGDGEVNAVDVQLVINAALGIG